MIDILSGYTEVSKDTINAESNLVADLGLSSLDVIDVIVAFEDEFNIEFPDQIIKDLTTVGDVAAYLEGHL